MSGIMATYSPFTITPKEAGQLVNCYRNQGDNRHCYLMHVTFATVYGEHQLPQSCFKKLPRLINAIPLVAGRMTSAQAQQIIWRYVEGGRDVHTFMSRPLTFEEAEEYRLGFKERLQRHAKNVFGDVTVKATIVLSRCLHYDEEFFINDIADSFDEGLHFKD